MVFSGLSHRIAHILQASLPRSYFPYLLPGLMEIISDKIHQFEGLLVMLEDDPTETKYCGAIPKGKHAADTCISERCYPGQGRPPKNHAAGLHLQAGSCRF
jgi:hypothetical protein